MNYHGHFKLWQENQLLFAEIHGAWSMETALDYAAQVKQRVQSMDGKPWARIVYLDQWQLGTPDFEQVMKDLMTWCALHQLKYTAYVFHPNNMKEHQLDKFINSADYNNQKKIFTNQQEAFEWLKSVGFLVASQSA